MAKKVTFTAEKVLQNSETSTFVAGNKQLATYNDDPIYDGVGIIKQGVIDTNRVILTGDVVQMGNTKKYAILQAIVGSRGREKTIAFIFDVKKSRSSKIEASNLHPGPTDLATPDLQQIAKSDCN